MGLTLKPRFARKYDIQETSDKNSINVEIEEDFSIMRAIDEYKADWKISNWNVADNEGSPTQACREIQYTRNCSTIEIQRFTVCIHAFLHEIALNHASSSLLFKYRKFNTIFVRPSIVLKCICLLNLK